MTVEEIIGILVDRYCRNRSHLADMIDVSPQVVNNWIYRDHIPNRGIEAIISRFPQIDRNWLRGGSTLSSSGPLPLPEEDEENDETQDLKTTQNTEQESAEHKVGKMSQNKVTELLASEMQSSQGDISQLNNKESLIPLQMPRHNIKYAFLCHGDSMLPRIQDGDYIGVGEPIGRYEDFQQGVPYLVQTTDGRFMVKMVQDPGPSSAYLLLSTENPNYELADGGKLAKKELYAAYRVLMIMRDI